MSYLREKERGKERGKETGKEAGKERAREKSTVGLEEVPTTHDAH